MLKYQHIENKYEEIKNTGKKVTLKDQRQRQKSNCTVVDQRQSVNLSNNSISSWSHNITCKYLSFIDYYINFKGFDMLVLKLTGSPSLNKVFELNWMTLRGLPPIPSNDVILPVYSLRRYFRALATMLTLLSIQSTLHKVLTRFLSSWKITNYDCNPTCIIAKMAL